MKTIAFVEDGRLKTLMPAKKSLEKALETAPVGSIIVSASEIPEKRYRSACTIQFGVIQKDLDRFPVIDRVFPVLEIACACSILTLHRLLQQ